MKICLLYSKKDAPTPEKCGLMRGLISHAVRENTLYTAKNLPFDTADILVVSADAINASIASAIRNEASRRKAHGVFLDTECDFPENAFAPLSVFTPQRTRLPRNSVPVIETTFSGGSLIEYIEAFSPPFSISIKRTAQEFLLPAEDACGKELSQSELRRLFSRHNPDIFFSPELYRKYFMYEPEKSRVALVLFDDAETISHKLRLAKKHGASHAFIVYDEISDIFDDIF